jgi:hypothetical protein
MDLEAIIRELRDEKRRLDRLIAAFEEMEVSSTATAGLVRRHRGRKSMSPEERLAVSERMTRYWAKRRKR